MSFANPAVLLGLVAVLLFGPAALVRARRGAAAGRALVSGPLVASVAPQRPGRARQAVPIALLVFGAALLVVAAARPRIPGSAPLRAGTVMLVNDISNSMTATDVQPSRLGAAQRAALGFIAALPATLAIGSVAFARRPELLGSPSTDHRVAATAIRGLRPGGGGTAIGAAIGTALGAIAAVPRLDGRRPPGAIVLLSDGTSNVGVDPLAEAAAARQAHVRIDTVAIGTLAGTMQTLTHGVRRTIPAPVSPGQLDQIAAASGGRFFAAPDQARAQVIYAHLAATLGRRRVLRSLLWAFAAAGLAAVLLAVALSLAWFGRLL